MNLNEYEKKLKKKIFNWVVLINLVLGFQNIYFYVHNDSWINLVIGALNIGVFVWNRHGVFKNL